MKKPAFMNSRGAEGGRKRGWLILRIAIVVIAVVSLILVAKLKGTGGSVDFTALTENAVPQQISSEIIPEYRDMERALACICEDKVYVLAMRGEKPTTGYDIAIESMELNTDKNDEDTLTVNVLFTDPQAGASLTQAQTYPYIVAETDLQELPDKIEMQIKYAD